MSESIDWREEALYWAECESETWKAMKAENERLRAALKKIADIEDDEWGGDWAEIELAREIAHQALSEPGTTADDKDAAK